MSGQSFIPVAEAMSTALLTATPDEVAAVVSERASRRGVHHVLVVHSSGGLLGILCGCDLEEAWPDTRVGDLMTSCLFTIPSLSLLQAASTMERYGIGVLPVVERDGQLVGIVTRADLRQRGALPDERGVDPCASCGADHSLRPRMGNDVRFCRACAEVGRRPPDEVVLGGFD